MAVAQLNQTSSLSYGCAEETRYFSHLSSRTRFAFLPLKASLSIFSVTT